MKVNPKLIIFDALKLPMPLEDVLGLTLGFADFVVVLVPFEVLAKTLNSKKVSKKENTKSNTIKRFFNKIPLFPWAYEVS